MIRKLPFEYRITLIYLLVGLGWIFFSDILLERLISNTSAFRLFQSLKGSIYVLATALLLFFLVRNNVRKENRSRQKLQESELRYRSVFHNSKSVMLLVDSLSGWIADANKAATEFYGYSFEELSQMNVNDLQVQDKDEQSEDLLSELNGNQNFCKTKQRLKSGKIRDVELYSGKVLLQGRTMIYAILHDITKQVQIEKELVEAKEKAEESSRLKSAFLANLSHEIRTPMNGIIGFTELLKDEELTVKDKNKYINIIHSSGEYLMRIISDIVEMSKLNTNQVQINQEVFDLTSLCHGILSEFEVSVPSVKTIHLTREIELPVNGEFWIETDKVKLKQILFNLLDNAIKNTKEGEIKIGCYLRGDNLLFYIKDTGRGIDPRYHDVIFEPFSQAEPEKGAIQQGSGLGLSIVKSYIDLMNGYIWLDSAPGEGSVFYFTMPYNPGKHSVNTKDDNLTKENTKQKQTSKVLVVEDDEVNFVYFKEVLEMNNIEVIHARNGQEAVDICRRGNGLDLIFMDIKMPVMNGYDALQYIKDEYPRIRVVAQTAYALKNEQETIFDAGFDGYLAKPVQKEKILQFIE